MMRAVALALTVTACAGLAACGEDPQLLSANGNGIAVRLGDGDGAMAEAVDIANRHCVNVRKLAVLQTVSEVEGARLAFFECVRV